MRTWLWAGSIAGVVGVCAGARADALPPLPVDFECPPGHTVQQSHGGPSCVRPYCQEHADCTDGTPCLRRCGHIVRPAGCEDPTAQGPGARNARAEPPGPCDGYMEYVGDCLAPDWACPEGNQCLGGSCAPPGTSRDPEAGGTTTTTTTTTTDTPPAAGGGCCGSTSSSASRGGALALLLSGTLCWPVARRWRRR